MRHFALREDPSEGALLRPGCSGLLVLTSRDGFREERKCDTCGDRIGISVLSGQVLYVDQPDGVYWLARRHRAVPDPEIESVQGDVQPFSPEETSLNRFLRVYGFCPRCRRVVYVHPSYEVRDVCPRDRPAVYRMLCSLFKGSNPRRDVFGLRLRWSHDCSAPAVPDPTAPALDKRHEVYDGPAPGTVPATA